MKQYHAQCLAACLILGVISAKNVKHKKKFYIGAPRCVSKKKYLYALTCVLPCINKHIILLNMFLNKRLV